MPKYKCGICLGEFLSDDMPTTCNECGSSCSSDFTLIKSKDIVILSRESNYRIYNKHTLDRDMFKNFFSALKLSDEDIPIYRFMEHDKPMLIIEKLEDGFCVFSPEHTKNHFLLNSVKIDKDPVPLKNGDKLQFYSTSYKNTIAVFNIQEAI